MRPRVRRVSEADSSEMIGEPYPAALILVDAKYLSDYRFRVWFKDGFTREIDMDGDLDGQVFQALKDKSFFAQMRFDAEIETAVWPNGTDLGPEFLRWGPHRADGCECGN